MELTDIFEELDSDLDGQLNSTFLTKEMFEEEMGDPMGEALYDHDFDSFNGCD